MLYYTECVQNYKKEKKEITFCARISGISGILFSCEISFLNKLIFKIKKYRLFYPCSNLNNLQRSYYMFLNSSW